jgi:hypothetical protein
VLRRRCQKYFETKNAFALFGTLDRLEAPGRQGLRGAISDRNESSSDRLAASNPEMTAMSDDNPQPPFVYEGLDPVPEPKSTIAEVSEAVKGAANRVGDAIEKGRKPGMPLSILSNIAREAPLGSLLVAFLLGVAVARRR